MKDQGTKPKSQIFGGELLKQGTRADAELPGTVQECTMNYNRALAKRINEVQVHNKAKRMLAAEFGKALIYGFDGLVVLDTYLMLHDRKSANIDSVIDWSGSFDGWKRRINKSLQVGIRTETVIQTGKSLGITEKGRKMLDRYDPIFEEAKNIYITKAAAKLKSLNDKKLEKKNRRSIDKI